MSKWRRNGADKTPRAAAPVLSRRGVLALPGLSGAVVACGTASPTWALPPRAWVGQDPDRGHVLRERTPHNTGPLERTRTRVAIVGAGVAGLCAAWQLRRRGVTDILVLELEDEIGGTARGGALARSAHPLGAHYLPAPGPDTPELSELLLDLGAVFATHAGAVQPKPGFVCAAPLERHFAGGRWYPGLYPAQGESDEEAAQREQWHQTLVSLDGARGDDGVAGFRLPVLESSLRFRALDAISMAEWLDREGLRSSRLRWAIDYACRDDYGCRLADTSAFAALHHFLARGYEALSDRELITWPEGNAWLARQLAARAELGERLRTKIAVAGIDATHGTITARDVSTGGTLEVTAEHILWAAPRFVLPFVLTQPSDDPLPRGALEYTPWLVASLELDRPPGGFGAPLSWDNVPIDASNLGYVVATHGQGLDETSPATVITYYEPLCDDAPAFARASLYALSIDAACERVLAALEHMHPRIRQWVVAMSVSRWGHAMVRPTPGSLFGPTRALARQPIGRLIPCAADTAGLPLFEEAFYRAIRVADQVAARMGAG